MKKLTLTFLLGVFLPLILFYSIAGATTTHDDTITLIRGTLIDGTGAPPLLDAVLIIEGEYIKEVGSLEKISMPDGAKVMAVKGSTILPGFINTHIHKGYNEYNLKTWVKNGVTTVRDLGGNPRENLFAFRDRVNQDPQYARLVAAGPMVTVPGGYPIVPWGAPIALPVTSQDDARRIANFLLDDGADIIKIALDSGRSFGRKIPIFSLEEAKAVIAAAHKRGTVVSAHVLMSEDLEHALNARVDDIAHMVMDNPTDDLIKRVVEQGVYWVPTLELWHGVDPRLRNVAIRNLRRFVKAGGLVALGTDYAGYRSRFDLGMPIREIRWMEKAGMTPIQIIVAATQNAAHVCNLGDKIGTLEKGKIADVLIVKGNPLEDLETLLKPRLVIHSGKIIRETK